MNDLISRNALKAEVETLIGYSLSYESYEAIINAIDNAPTVELFCSYLSDGEVKQPCVEGPCEQDRPQGEWKPFSLLMEDGKNTRHSFRCPFCRYVEGYAANFCAKCGADMRQSNKSAN